MCRQVMHVFCAIALSFFGFLGLAQASSLGKVDVASHLGEPFYAEIPLGLEKNENIADIFVELASAADYRLLEVFHDSSIDQLRVDVKSDSRGNRIELTSTNIMEAPFLNLVLKVRHGRATHFKKFSIFLDLPRAATIKTSSEKFLPVRRIEDPIVKPVSEPVLVPVATTIKKASQPALGTNWARIDNYGPMVFGDTISTVARRLRIDERYTQQQVMVALFEKNKDKFSKENINLIRAGTYLDVPSAKEVEHITHAQATSLLRQHNARWKELTKQAKYAKVQVAQENRYSKHVSMGETAEGVASQAISKKDSVANTLAKVKKAVKAPTSTSKTTSPITPVMTKGDETSAALLLENNILQLRLKEMEAKVSKLESLPASDQSLAASNARIEKLEIQLARQSGALDKARKQQAMQSETSDEISLLTWVLMGFVALLSIIAGYLAYALHGQRRHPVEGEVSSIVEPDLEEIEIEEIEEIEIEEVADKKSPVSLGSHAKGDVVGHTEHPVDSLAVRIPELTDEDTSEMEAFSEAEEDPDPNVDYLTEADVYMRYGMEDEAEKQVGMALRLRSDNKEAHIKLAEIRHARGDTAGVAEAGRVAQAALTGAALTAFVTVFDALAVGVDQSSGLDNDVSTTTEEPASSNISDEISLPSDDSFEVADFELPDFSVSDVASDDLSGMPSTESADTENPQAADDKHGDMLDFDLSGMDLSGLDVGADELVSIESSAESNDALDGIDLSGLHVGDDELPPIENSPEADNDLDGIDLFDLHVGNDDLVSIESLDESNDALDGIDLSGLDVDDDELVSIESFDESNDALDGIDLSGLDVGDDELVSIESFDESNDALDGIDLSGLDVGDDELVSIESFDESNDALDGIDLSGFDVGDDELVSIKTSSESSDILDFDLSSLDMPTDEVLEEENTPITSGLESTVAVDLSQKNTPTDQASDTVGLSAEMQALDSKTEEFDLSALQTNFDGSSLTQKMSAVDVVASAIDTSEGDELLSMALDLDDLGIDFDSFEKASEAQVSSSNAADSLADPFNALGDADSGDKFDAHMSSLDDVAVGFDNSEEIVSSNDTKAAGITTVSDDLTSMAFNLDDLDVDMNIAKRDDDLDEFSSTIQATLLELGVDDSDLDVVAVPIVDTAPDSGSMPNTDDEFDFSEDLELNNLLRDLDSFAGEKKDKT